MAKVERKGDFIYVDGVRVFAPRNENVAKLVQNIQIQAAKLLAANNVQDSNAHKIAADHLERKLIS